MAPARAQLTAAQASPAQTSPAQASPAQASPAQASPAQASAAQTAAQASTGRPTPATLAAASAGVSYGGDAYAIGLSGVTVAGRPVADQTLGDTGALPASGGGRSEAPAHITLPSGLGTLTVTGGSVTGAAGTTRASFKVAGVSILPKLSLGSGGDLCLPLLGCVVGGGAADLVDIGLAQSAASASASNPDSHAGSAAFGTITLLGGVVKVPIGTTANTTVDLGLVSITANQSAYDASTNTASARAVVLDFPKTGQLAGTITGTITVASATATVKGSLSCTSGAAVSCATSGTTLGHGSARPQRVGGANRIRTAIDVSRATFPKAGSASSVVLSTALDFPDGLAGIPLAAHAHGPLLLTEPASERAGINPLVLAEISRALTPHAGKPIYLLGGSSALSPTIGPTLARLGYDPISLSGPNRFATAVGIANALGNPSTVFLVTGRGFADALSAGPAAVHQGGVVLLTDGSSMRPETAAYLAAHPGDSVFAVGGPAAAADPAATPIVGADEFETNALVAAFFGNPAVIGVARGDQFPDALDGGAQVASDGGPIILVHSGLPVPKATGAFVKANASRIQTANVYGGGGAIAPSVVSAIATYLSG